MPRIKTIILVGSFIIFGIVISFSYLNIVHATNTCTSASTGSWNTAGTWTSCGGGIPTDIDTVTILSGHIVTVDTTAVASTVTINANAGAGGNGISINSGQSLVVGGAVTLNIPTAAATDLNVGAGSLTATSIAIPGGGASRFATVSVSTGTVTVSGSITFSGTAARARYTSTDTSTTNIGGDFGAGGTLTTSGTGKFNFNGSVAQIIGAYTTFNNIEINNSSGDVTFGGTATIGGTLLVNTGTLDVGAITTFIVTGATTINSNLKMSSVTGTKTFHDITIASGGTLNFTAAEVVTHLGSLTVNGTGTITGTTGVWAFQQVGGGTISGTATSIAITSATFTTSYALNIPAAIPTVTVTGAAVVLTNNTTLTINTSLAGTGQMTQASGMTLNLGGGITITTLNATVNPNEVHYTSTSAGQTIKTTSYYNLFVDKSGQTGILASGSTNVLGNLVLSAGTFSIQANSLTVTGTTSLHGSLKDVNNTGITNFGGLVTVFSDGSWDCIPAENTPFNFSNGLVFNGTTFVSGPGFYTFQNNNQSITGSSAVTISNLVVNGIQLNNSAPMTVTTSLTGSGSFIEAAGQTLNLSGTTNTITGLDATATGNTVNYNGTSAQTIIATSYERLNVSKNTSGSVNITANPTVTTTLTLGATKLSTSTNKIILSPAATISRTSGYVIGTINKQFSSSTAFSYAIGDASLYTPITVTLAGVSGSGSIDGSVTTGDDPDISNSGIDSSQSINRYWSLVNNGLIYSSYDAVMDFDGSDVDAGATVTRMVSAKRSNGSWTIVPSSCSGTSCTVSGLTTMSDFQPGIALDQTAPTIMLLTNENSPTGATTINITVIFSEPVNGFELSDITVTNGTKGNFVAHSSTAYTFDITAPIDGATVTVSIASGVAKDAAQNGNQAAADLSLVSDQTPMTSTTTATPTNNDTNGGTTSPTTAATTQTSSSPRKVNGITHTGTADQPQGSTAVANDPPGQPPLFDIISQPQLLAGRSGTIVLTISWALIIGIILGFLFLFIKRRRHQRELEQFATDLKRAEENTAQPLDVP